VHCQSNDQWQAPSAADTLENPYELDDKQIINGGQELYLMLCASCHGENGNGGGGAGQAFDPPPSDFTTERVQKQSDGALFWKLSEGNPPGMLSYKKMLSEDERWQIVTYLRTFGEQ
jgi:mono/diheme cytochrome c family protein